MSSTFEAQMDKERSHNIQILLRDVVKTQNS